MDLTHVMLRLERVTGDACKRWHADYVSVRLICTYRGAATRWIEQPGDRQRALATGTVGLFKGGFLPATTPSSIVRHPSWGREKTACC